MNDKTLDIVAKILTIAGLVVGGVGALVNNELNDRKINNAVEKKVIEILEKNQ